MSSTSDFLNGLKEELAKTRIELEPISNTTITNIICKRSGTTSIININSSKQTGSYTMSNTSDLLEGAKELLFEVKKSLLISQINNSLDKLINSHKIIEPSHQREILKAFKFINSIDNSSYLNSEKEFFELEKLDKLIDSILIWQTTDSTEFGNTRIQTNGLHSIQLQSQNIMTEK